MRGRDVPKRELLLGAWGEWAAWVPTLAPVESSPEIPAAPTRDQVRRITNWLFRSGYLKFADDGAVALGPLAWTQNITALKQAIPHLRTVQEVVGSILLLDDAEIQWAVQALQREDILLVSARGLVWPAEGVADYGEVALLAHRLNLALEGWSLQTRQPIPSHQITISAVLQFEQRVREAYDEPPADDRGTS